MLDACVLTIVRDGDDYLDEVIKTLAPHVSSMRIWIDSRSQDQTRAIVQERASKHGNIIFKEYPVTHPLADLVDMRNDQMGFTEPWGFIVDSDELHHEIEHYKLGRSDAYAFKCHAPWNEYQAHGASGKAVIGRIFKNEGKLEWKGRFGKEMLYRYNKPVFSKDTTILPHRYLHFTHLKKDKWRTEMNQKRVADDRNLYDLPSHITKIIQDIHEKTMQTV